MRNVIYCVHSNLHEDLIAAEFDYLSEAIEYAKGDDNGLKDQTWVEVVELERNDFGETTDVNDTKVVWSYEDEIEDGCEDCSDEITFNKDDLNPGKFPKAGEGELLTEIGEDACEDRIRELRQISKERDLTDDEVKDLAYCSAQTSAEIDEDYDTDSVIVGSTIRIIHLEGEDDRYDNKIGKVTHIDDIGQLHGTWGSIGVLPGVDVYEIIPEDLTEANNVVRNGGPAIVDNSKVEVPDNVVVKCPKYNVVSHSEDEKPLDCKMKKPALEKPLAGDKVDVDLYEDLCAESKLNEAKKDEDELPPDPGAVKVEVHNTLNNLVADEIEAIDGYEEAKADIIEQPIEHKDEIISTIDHIKDEEKEHIDELINASSKILFAKSSGSKKPETQVTVEGEEKDEDEGELLFTKDDLAPTYEVEEEVKGDLPKSRLTEGRFFDSDTNLEDRIMFIAESDTEPAEYGEETKPKDYATFANVLVNLCDDFPVEPDDQMYELYLKAYNDALKLIQDDKLNESSCPYYSELLPVGKQYTLQISTLGNVDIVDESQVMDLKALDSDIIGNLIKKARNLVDNAKKRGTDFGTYGVQVIKNIVEAPNKNKYNYYNKKAAKLIKDSILYSQGLNKAN